MKTACDRCDAWVVSYSDVEIVDTDGNEYVYELCEACTEAFFDFMNGDDDG